MEKKLVKIFELLRPEFELSLQCDGSFNARLHDKRKVTLNGTILTQHTRVTFHARFFSGNALQNLQCVTVTNCFVKKFRVQCNELHQPYTNLDTVQETLIILNLLCQWGKHIMTALGENIFRIGGSREATESNTKYIFSQLDVSKSNLVDNNGTKTPT